MLEIDYVIERDEKDKKVCYTPDQIPKELANVTYIKGPNSIGKSTLLNILAVGFFAHRMSPDEIQPSLLRDIKGLINKSHQNLKFKIKLSNPRTGVTLVTEKPDFQTQQVIMKEITQDKERFIDFDEFVKEYRLIYDIPENPTQRIEKILDNIKADLSEKARKLKRLERKVREEKEKVEKAKDPEREKDLKAELEKSREELKEQKDLLEKRERLLTKLKKFYYTKFYLKYSEKEEKKRKEKEKLRREVERKDKRKSVLSKEVKNIVNRKKRYVENIRKNRKLAVEILSRILSDTITEERLRLWLQRDIDKEIEEFDDRNEFRNDLKWLEDKLDQKLDELYEDNKLEEAGFIQKFISFLERFEDSEFFIPEVEKSIEEYIQTLSEKLEDFRSIINEKENLEELEEYFTGIRSDFRNAIKEQESLNRKIEEDESLREELNQNKEFDELEIKEKVHKGLENKAREFREKLINEGVDPDRVEETFEELQQDDELKEFQNSSEEKLEVTINKLDKEINGIESRLDDTRDLIELNESELEEIKEQETHELIDYGQELGNLQSTLDSLLRKIDVEFVDYIEKMRMGEEPEVNSAYERFAEIVSSFIAKRIGKIKHIKKDYVLDKVDLIQKKVLTEEGKEIHLSDMGTGQSQSAYIDGILSMNDNRKIIALFDEVGMMDENSLKPVKDRLVSLFENEKLSLGLIVQKDNNKVDIESLTDNGYEN